MKKVVETIFGVMVMMAFTLYIFSCVVKALL